MKFWKMNGAGNDFIILNNLEEGLDSSCFSALARLLCERRLSIGADGLMIVEKPEGDADIRMLFYNSDGSLGEMCGNGARCICRYAYENGLAGEWQRIETTAGLVTGERIDIANYRIRLNDPSVYRPDLSFDIQGQTLTADYVELGRPGIPHLCVEFQGLKQFTDAALRPLGEALRRHPSLSRGANVNFYEITGPDKLWIKTFERGVEDFTYACGTGTGSTVYALTQKGKVSGTGVSAAMRGGTLSVDVLDEGLFLTGPTNIVAIGEVCDENLPAVLNSLK